MSKKLFGNTNRLSNLTDPNTIIINNTQSNINRLNSNKKITNSIQDIKFVNHQFKTSNYENQVEIPFNSRRKNRILRQQIKSNFDMESIEKMKINNLLEGYIEENIISYNPSITSYNSSKNSININCKYDENLSHINSISNFLNDNIKANNIHVNSQNNINKFPYPFNAHGTNNHSSNINLNESKNAFRKPHNSIIKNKIDEENTEILIVNLCYMNKSYLMSIRRYDDIFFITKNFFEINKIPYILIKPVIEKIFNSLNNIYSLFNKRICHKEIEHLKKIESECIDIENSSMNISSISNISLYENEIDCPVFKLNKSF